MIRIFLLVLITLASVTASAASEEQLWQAIDQLKARIERLESQAGIVEPPAKVEPVEKTAATHSGKVFARYWLSQNKDFTGKSEAPLREGFMSLDTVIKLAPEVYGYKTKNFFDDHDDPSLYPIAAVSIEGELDIKQAGLYQLVVRPTPPREVGGAGNVEVSLEVSIGSEKLFTMPFSMKLSSRQKEISLKAGRQPIRIKILARSPGFGPSPTRTDVYIGLQATTEISPNPINLYLAKDRQK